jgi:hypothetical protein
MVVCAGRSTASSAGVDADPRHLHQDHGHTTTQPSSIEEEGYVWGFSSATMSFSAACQGLGVTP